MLITDILQTVTAAADDFELESAGNIKDAIFTASDMRTLLGVGFHGKSFIVDAFAQTADLPDPPRLEDMENPRLPFPVTVFEHRIDDLTEVFSRVAVVAIQMEPEDEIKGAVLGLPTGMTVARDAYTGLDLPIVYGRFRICDHPDTGVRSAMWISGNPVDRLLKMGSMDEEQFRMEMRFLCRPAFYALAMLQCANVTYEEVEQEINRQERRRRQRKKIKTARTYRIVVKVPGRKTVVVGERIAGSAKGERAFHAVRGHFSTYTEAGKLFGKYTGTFWIPAHVRGTGEPSGAKGYVVVPGQEAA